MTSRGAKLKANNSSELQQLQKQFSLWRNTEGQYMESLNRIANRTRSKKNAYLKRQIILAKAVGEVWSKCHNNMFVAAQWYLVAQAKKVSQKAKAAR